MSEITLKGRILGFEEYENYVIQNAFGDASPFRLLRCNDAALSFVVVNPYRIFEDYTFELEDDLMKNLKLDRSAVENIAILCIVRPNENLLFANLRSPMIINAKEGLFEQVILQNETYGISVPFAVKKPEK